MSAVSIPLVDLDALIQMATRSTGSSESQRAALRRARSLAIGDLPPREFSKGAAASRAAHGEGGDGIAASTAGPVPADQDAP